jgi:hypothetical protein
MLLINKNLPKVKTGDSNVDSIWASFINESIELTDVQQEIKERLLIVWTLRHKHPTVKTAFAIYQKKTKKNRAQFFRDTRNADAIFGNLLETNFKANKAIYEEMVKTLYEKCLKSKDIDNAIKLLKMLGDSWKIDEEEQKGFNPEKLTNPQINLKISKSTRELIINSLSKTGIADYNKLKIEEAEIVEE